MISKVRMPRMDANVDEAAIGCWLKNPGDGVAAGEPIVEIITDKATFQLEGERAGFLRAHLAPEKSVVPVGYIIALLSDEESEPLPDVTDENEAVMRRYREALLFGAGQASEPPSAEGAPGRSGKVAASGPRVRATPAARRLARRAGVSLEEIGARTGGIISEDDVLGYMRRRGQTRGGGDAR